MWSSKHRTSKIEVIQCPVCQAILGKRETNSIYIAHCAECRTTFTWKPWANKPFAELDVHKPQKCGCGGCGR